MLTCDQLLEIYLLEHDVRGSTETYYRRAVSVFRRWWTSQKDGPPFEPRTISRFLKDKQQEGRSSYYRRSLRSALVAILRHSGNDGRVRPVKLHELKPDAWTSTEVARLTAAARQYHHRDARYWPTLIPAAYYSGLSQIDLERLTRKHVADDGTVRIARSKTGSPVKAWIPPDILQQRPAEGLLWKRPYSEEMFRRHFATIVNGAGLTGTFKKLRRSSGTLVEELNPGKGHEHLANSRAVFEKFYLAWRIEPETKRPPPLGESD